MERVVFIMRGLPGSGKSSVAQHLAAEDCIVSMDDYWRLPEVRMTIAGGGQFDDTQLAAAVKWTREQFIELLDAGEDTIVVDNTATRFFEYAWFYNRAREAGCTVHILHVEAPLVDCIARQTHNVPLGKILEMRDRWEPVCSKDPVARVRALEEVLYGDLIDALEVPSDT